MTSWITVCDTCKRQDRVAEDGAPTCGESLAALVEDTGRDTEGVKIRRQSCLMGCDHGCNVAIQANGKLTYVLGRFEPSQDAADAIVDYARLHAESLSGQVPFRQWPQGVKGHFVSRIPTVPDDR